MSKENNDGNSVDDSVDFNSPDAANDSEVNDFFNKLDQEVNDVAYDDPGQKVNPTQATQKSSDPVQVTQNSDSGSDNTDMWESDSNPYKKRYSDSSRESIKNAEALNELKPFIPVLDAMKNDSGLVDHVRDYLDNGGAPEKTIQDQLQLDDDFIYDAQDAMHEPDSDSAKVLNAHVDKIVEKRIGAILEREKIAAQQAETERAQAQQEVEFKQKHNMSDEDYAQMVEQAQNHVLSLDDIYYILNKDQSSANVKNATQADMINQMRNVRNMPTSQSQANNMGETRTTEEEMFDSIFGDTTNKDSLFG